MTPETVFLICNYGILPAWVLLVVAPRSPWTRWVVHSPLVPLALAGVYIWAMLGDQTGAPGGSFFTLGGVMNLYWIVGLAVFVLLEKVIPLGHWLGRVAGVVLIGWGAYLPMH